MKKVLGSALAILMSLAAYMWAEEPMTVGEVQLIVPSPMVTSDYCLVQQIQIELPKGTPAGMFKQEFCWKPETHHLGGSYYRSNPEKAQVLSLLIVAMLAPGQGAGSPPRISFYMTDRSKTVFEAHTADGSLKLSDVLKLDAKPGRYRLEQPIQIGEYGGSPMHVTISPKALAQAQQER